MMSKLYHDISCSAGQQLLLGANITKAETAAAKFSHFSKCNDFDEAHKDEPDKEPDVKANDEACWTHLLRS
jgi:hypothetical protein